MKKILIGRGAGNDIRLKDESDRVSRRQAVIEVSPTGKMRIHDTSSNGTFVNGVSVPKPGGLEVKRGDKVDFAHVMELDWSLIRDPYKGMKISVGIFVVVLIALAVLFFVYSDELLRSSESEVTPTEEVESVSEDTGSEIVDIVEPSGSSVSRKSKKSTGSKQSPVNEVKPGQNPTTTENGSNTEEGVKNDNGETVNPTDKTNNHGRLVPDNDPRPIGSMKKDK